MSPSVEVNFIDSTIELTCGRVPDKFVALGRLTLRDLAEMAGMRSEAAVNFAIKRYQRIVETDALEASHAERCIARLNKIGEMLNV